MGLLYIEKCLLLQNTSQLEKDNSNEGSLHSDAKSQDILSHPTPDGSPTNRLVHFLSDKVATEILQLEAMQTQRYKGWMHLIRNGDLPTLHGAQ